MGNARARGTYAERKANPQGSVATVPTKAERLRDRYLVRNGAKVLGRLNSSDGRLTSADGRTHYENNGGTLRRVTN